MQKWIHLALAIVCEVIATSAMKSSEGFSRLGPSCLVVAGYGTAFYFLAMTLKVLPVGLAYAIWAGAGTALVALVAWLFLGQKLDLPGILGILLIVSGVVVLNVFSKAAAH